MVRLEGKNISISANLKFNSCIPYLCLASCTEYFLVCTLNICGLLTIVLQLWTYKVLGLTSPESSYQDQRVIPRALRWGQGFREKSAVRGQLDFFCSELDRLTFAMVRCKFEFAINHCTPFLAYPLMKLSFFLQVPWHVWDEIQDKYLASSIEVKWGRVLLECAYG